MEIKAAKGVCRMWKFRFEDWTEFNKWSKILEADIVATSEVAARRLNIV